MHLDDQRSCSPLGVVAPKRSPRRKGPPRTPEGTDDVTISAKDLDLISEVVKASRVVDSDDMAKFTNKLDKMDERITTIHADLQTMIREHGALKSDISGLADAWKAGSTLLGIAKVGSKVIGAIAAVVLAIGVIGSIITHPELWFSKGT